MSQLYKCLVRALLFVILSVGSAVTINAETVTFTVPDFNGTFQIGGTFPRPSITVNTFNIVLPAGFEIGSATLSGTLGNSVNGSSASLALFLDSLMVATCAPGAACTGASGSVGPTPFTFTFTGANFSLLTDGAAVLTLSQLGPGTVRLGNLTLTITSVPEPATLILFGSGLTGVAAGLRRKRMQKRLPC